MKKKHDLLGIYLASVTATVLLAMLIIRAFFPRIILPDFDLTLILPIVLVSLVLENYISGGKSHRDYRLVPLYGALIFGLFPMAALLVFPMDALICALIGILTATVCAFLFDQIKDRLSDEPIAKAAPAISAIGLYLASQCVLGIF